MVSEGIVLGHRTSGRGIEVYRAKIEAIEKLPYPRDIRGNEAFLVLLVSIEGPSNTSLKYQIL
jgi:hypothetical protein